uniref:Uncharacterized protein n=1 Tax=viral metagenome TaxID=1070528 RepID=A0A6C0BNM0_9ZZZZ
MPYANCRRCGRYGWVESNSKCEKCGGKTTYVPKCTGCGLVKTLDGSGRCSDCVERLGSGNSNDCIVS